MTAGIKPLTKVPAWRALNAHYDRIRDLHLWCAAGGDGK